MPDGGRSSRRMLMAAAAATVAMLAIVGLLRQPLADAGPHGARAAVPGLSPERAAISRLLGADERSFWAVSTRTGLSQRNADEGLTVTYGRSGPLIHSAHGTVGIGLSLLGRGALVEPAGAAAPLATRNRVSYNRGGGVVEWYANGPFGLEQGVTVASRPLAGEPGRLRIVFALRGSLAAHLDDGVVSFGRPGSSQGLLRYLGLSVTDARGRALPAQLSLSGGRLTIGVDDAGAQYPITVDPTVEAANLTESNGTDEDRFGSSIAQSASGSLVVVGAPSAGSDDAGAAYVFVEPSTGWAAATQTTELTDSDAGTDFGAAVAVVGTSIVVGAPYASSEGYVDAWAQPTNGWAHPGSPVELTASDGAEGDDFGSALAASGTQLFVGAPDAGSNYEGAVYEFNEPGGGWTTPATQTAELTAGDSSGLGESLAADGSTVVAGAPYEGSDDNGAAYVFTMPSGGWSKPPPVPAELTASDGTDYAEFGEAVAINAGSGTIAVGSPYQGSDYTGSVYVYQEPTTGWASEEQKAEMTGTAEYNPIGYVVAITNAAGTGPPTGVVAVHPTSAGWSIGVVTSEWNAGVVLLFPASNGTWSDSSGGTAITFGISDASPYSLSVQPGGIAIGNWAGNWFGNGGTAVESGSAYELPVAQSITVNDAGDAPSSDPSGTDCVTADATCTLRAAIQTANAEPTSGSPVSITFNIPGVAPGTIATISPASPLPAITHPVDIDATTQPSPFLAGTRKIGAIIDGASAGTGANGLDLAAGSAGSVVTGLQIEHFTGDGVRLGDDDQQLADSVLTDDTTGAEVAGDDDTVGSGNGLVGDIFFTDGDVPGLTAYLSSLAGQSPTDGSFEAGLSAFGAGILLTQPSSGAQITGDYIGVHGSGFGSSPDLLGDDGFATTNLAGDSTVMPFGVLIAPSSGTISDVTIGGPGSASDVDSGTIFGVMAVAGDGSPISGLSVLGSSFGAGTSGAALNPLGGLIGVFAAGSVSGLQLGSPAAGDTFQGLLMGAVLAGTHVSTPLVQGDAFGTNTTLGSLSGGLGLHDFLGLVLGDSQGAQIGGTTAGQGNNFYGDGFGLTLAGEHVANDTIAGNTIGGSAGATFTTFADADFGQFSNLLGVLFAGNTTPGVSSASQNVAFQNNTIQANFFGGLSVDTVGTAWLGNTIQNNAFGLSDGGSGGMQIGGAAGGQGNAFLNNGIGLYLANTDPDPGDLAEGQVNPSQASSSARQGFLDQPDQGLAFDGVDAVTTANLSPTIANTSSAPGTNTMIIGNRFGVDASGNPQPNELPVLISGDEHGVQFGGTAAGQGNTVEDNRDTGLIISGAGQHNPTVQVLGNTIYNNENFTGSLTGAPGLGIDLAYGNDASPPFDLGINPQDQTQPDVGPNNTQNSPVLSSAVSGGGQLTITGSLHGVASTSYLLEVFADQNENPFGAGEGQTLLGRLSLSTDANGNVSFTSTFASPGAGYRYVSSTATTVPTSGPGVTSEFSVDAPITAVPSTGTGTGSGGGGAGASQVGTTTVTQTAGSAATGSSSVTLPATASCSSATTSACTVTVTGTVAASTTTKTTLLAIAAKRSSHHAAPVAIGKDVFMLAPGATGTLKLTLTAHGLSLLRTHKTLQVTITVKISGQGRQPLTNTFKIRLTYKKPHSPKR